MCPWPDALHLLPTRLNTQYFALPLRLSRPLWRAGCTNAAGAAGENILILIIGRKQLRTIKIQRR
ncbi:MAG: hypothetical protein CO188_02860 [Zetaproteobacteria bacterium CG_4_9_14_3_um_filter_54_145]|nr:MAG: hypothetical protein COX55_06920 [Zetaproteobacteria bacterium CG23_combo_of_CG06-09_8_20_14_all_54_7]PJA30573.1 MAG: hypothetical protein CO188_02860 [Zetaproteobacteria bacterium CG_4_9_14_3_um_filter_54_145]